MATLQELATDPEFLKLSEGARRIVGSRADPEFGKLSPEAQDIVLGRLAASSAEEAPGIGSVLLRRGITGPLRQMRESIPAMGDLVRFAGESVMDPRNITRAVMPGLLEAQEARRAAGPTPEGGVPARQSVPEGTTMGAESQRVAGDALHALGILAPLSIPASIAVGTPVELATGSETAGDIATVVGALASPFVARKVIRNLKASKLKESLPPKATNPADEVSAAIDEAGGVSDEAVAASGVGAAPATGDAAAFRNLRTPGRQVPPAGPMPEERIDPEMFDRLYGNLQPLSKEALYRVAQMNADDIAAQTRGVQSVERTEALAAELLPDLSKPLKAGTALNAEQIKSYINTVGAVQTKIDRLTDAIAGGQNDDLTKLAMSTAIQERAVAELSLFGARAELGRAMNILKFQHAAGVTGDSTLIRKALKLGGDPEQITAMLAKTDPADVLGRYRMLRDLRQPSRWDYAKYYYLTNILSGPRTHIRNILGNTSNLFFKGASTPFAAAGDYTRVALKGGEREVFAGEVPRQIYGVMHGFPQAVRKAAFMFKNGFALDDVATFEVGAPEIRGGIATNFVSRALGSADQFFRTLGAEMELHAGAYTMARKSLARQGLTGGALRDQIPGKMAEILDAKPPELMKQVAAYAERTVFQEQGSPAIDALYQLRKAWPALEFVVPFLRTPAGIMRQGVQSSPLGFATKLGRGTGRLSAQARGEAALGTVLLSFPAWMAATGRLSGSGPKDPGKKDALYAQGWQPNSMRLPLPDALVDGLGIPRSPEGEYWISYNLLQPVALPFSVVANAYEAWRDTDAKTTPAGMVGMIAAKTGNSVLQQSYLSGLFDITSALEDPARWGPQLIERYAQSAVLLSAAVRTVAQARDPVIRDPEGVGEAVEAIIPGMSQNVPPRLRASGEPVIRPGSPYVVPEISPVRRDPVREELARLDMDLPLSKKGDELKLFRQTMPLTRSQDFALRSAKGQATYAKAAEIMQTPAYRRGSDIYRRYILSTGMAGVRKFIGDKAKLMTLRKQDWSTADELLRMPAEEP